MPRVKIGPAEPERKTIDSRSRACAISTSAVFGPVGTRYSGDGPPLTCHVISCFGFWPIGFRPIISAIWIPRANDCSTARDHRTMPASGPRPRPTDHRRETGHHTGP